MLTASEACTKCGICAEVCPLRIIRMEAEGPQVVMKDFCIACGHCVAVCPHAALDNAKAPLARQVSLADYSAPDAATAAKFLRSRRSVRCYRPEPVPREKLEQLVEIARFAPSGGNTQGLSYLVVTRREEMKKLSDIVLDWIASQIDAGEKWTRPYAGVVDHCRLTGEDLILRNAPHLIIATAPKKLTIAGENSRYSLAYAELLAPSLGLGTCWAGFFEICAQAGHSPLYAQLDMAKNTAITGAIMAGYPCYSYQRLVDRNPLAVTWR